MKKIYLIGLIVLMVCSLGFKDSPNSYRNLYSDDLKNFDDAQQSLLDNIKNADLNNASGIHTLKNEIEQVRLKLKVCDFWLRYFEPIAYKKINGPLPVEWENEVFEKYEKPYKRLGAGLSLAEMYLDVPDKNKDSLVRLIDSSIVAMNVFRADSIVGQLDTFDHFFLCNRLFLLNLAAIYTTGFECPDKANVIPELRAMLPGVRNIYKAYNERFPGQSITADYLQLFDKMISFVDQQPADINTFDHFTFIRSYVNPLFAINQRLIGQYNVVSGSFNDYTLSNDCYSIFDKNLYTPQSARGIYSLVTDTAVLAQIMQIGKLLFYDPILSGNNERSCVSCHHSNAYFTDTTVPTAFAFDHVSRLPRNTPTLVDVIFNHLLMLDGREISLQSQGRDVITNPVEMGSNEKEVVAKVLSCKEYKNALKSFAKLTVEEKDVTLDHIVSAITYYYSKFSDYYSPFDDAMNRNASLDPSAVRGFNLFMGKGQCATCHYVPQFNGVPPPYIGSEFEVVGIPADNKYTSLSNDSGRYKFNPTPETLRAFRTGTVRNIAFTKPYMHNGVFNTLDEVIDFYDAGGGAGKKLAITNQTLATDSLHLTPAEKKDLISFLHALEEKVEFEPPPDMLPLSTDRSLNNRKVGGTY